MKTKAVVTGSSGFIGSHLVRHLSRTYEVVAPPDPFQDITTADLEGVEVLFHQAAITDPQDRDRKRMFRVNCEDALALFDRAIDAGVKKVVYASSAAVYGSGPVPFKEDQGDNPLTPYAESKALLDAFAYPLGLRRGVPITGLRYSNVYGPGEAHKGKAASVVYQIFQAVRVGNRPKLFEFGEQLRDWVYIEDVCRANVLAAEAGRWGVYNVGSGVATSFNDVVGTANVVLCTDLQPDYIPNPYAGTYQAHTCHDLTRATAEIGYRPQIDLFDGLLDMACKP